MASRDIEAADMALVDMHPQGTALPDTALPAALAAGPGLAEAVQEAEAGAARQAAAEAL